MSARDHHVSVISRQEIRRLSRRDAGAARRPQPKTTPPTFDIAWLAPGETAPRRDDSCAARAPTRRRPERSHRKLERDVLVCPARGHLSNTSKAASALASGERARTRTREPTSVPLRSHVGLAPVSDRSPSRNAPKWLICKPHRARLQHPRSPSGAPCPSPCRSCRASRRAAPLHRRCPVYPTRSAVWPTPSLLPSDSRDETAGRSR